MQEDSQQPQEAGTSAVWFYRKVNEGLRELNTVIVYLQPESDPSGAL